MGWFKRVKAVFGRYGLLLALAGWSVFLAGCAHTDPENLSERPWNAPRSWENGLPAGMLEGR